MSDSEEYDDDELFGYPSQGQGQQVGITIPVEQAREWHKRRQEIMESRGNMNYNRSEFVRDHVNAGLKQLAALTDTDADQMEKTVLGNLPESPDDAVNGEEIVDEILQSQREKIWDILDDHSAVKTHRGKYYKE